MSLDWKEKLEHEQKKVSWLTNSKVQKSCPPGKPASNCFVLSTYIHEIFTKIGIVVMNYIHLLGHFFHWFSDFFRHLKKIKKCIWNWLAGNAPTWWILTHRIQQWTLFHSSWLLRCALQHNMKQQMAQWDIASLTTFEAS